MTFKFKMTLLVEQTWEYEVEADTETEAREKAEAGDTVSEDYLGVSSDSVRERVVTE